MLNDNIKLQINYFHIYSFSIIIVQLYRYKADYQTRCESGNKYNVKSEDSDMPEKSEVNNVTNKTFISSYKVIIPV